MKRAQRRIAAGETFRDDVCRIVRRIPRGRVASYGEVAALAGYPRAARGVGGVLRWLSEEAEARVPWQRVINAAGRISARGDFYGAELQRRLLEDEGVVFGARGTVDLRRYGWRGGPRASGLLAGRRG